MSNNESVNLLDDFFESSPDLFCILDKEKRIVRCNSVLTELLRSPHDKLVDTPFSECLHLDDRLHFTEIVRSLSDNGSPETLRCKMAGDDTTFRAYDLKITRKKEHYYLTGRDVTEQATELQELQQNEYRLRQLSDNVADSMIYQLDSGINGEIRQFIYISKNVMLFHGISQEDAMEDATLVYKSIYPEDVSKLVELEAEAVANETTFRAEMRVVDPSGAIRWSLLLSEPHRDENNHLVFDGIEIDLTEIKNAELSFERSEGRFQRLIEGLGEKYGFFSHSAEGDFLFVSKHFNTLFDVSWDNAVGHNWRELALSDESLRAGEESDKRLYETGQEQTVELTSLHRDGTQRIIKVTYDSVNENGEIICMEGICVDITEEKERENLLQQEQQKLKDAQKIAKIGNWELNLLTNELTWSDQIYHIFEIDRERFTATYEGFLDAIHPEDRELVNNAYSESLQNQNPYEITHRLLMTDGRIKYVQEQCETLFDALGKPILSKGTVQDITEAYKAEVERNRLRNELAQSQKMDAVGQLAGGVAHDFNNMLGVILGHTEELLAIMSPENKLEYESLTEIRKAGERSAALTKQLLSFSRQEMISPKRMELNKTIEGMLNILRRLIGENITIHWRPTSKHTPVFMDHTQIDQVLTNLCVNARDAIEGTGVITIATEVCSLDATSCQTIPGSTPGDYVLLTIEDTGKGMDEETAQKVFDPFFTTKGVGKGTGLGLSTVYGIIKQNRCVITLDSTPDKGTTFTVYVPIDTEHDEIEQREKIDFKSLNGEGVILLVEDEEMLLKTLQRVLERHGYDVITATAPEEALRLVDSADFSIDLLLSDMIMPEMNGRELAREVLKRLPELHVLFMSGYTFHTFDDKHIDTHEVNFIQKPFELTKLLHGVKEILQGNHFE